MSGGGGLGLAEMVVEGRLTSSGCDNLVARPLVLSGFEMRYPFPTTQRARKKSELARQSSEKELAGVEKPPLKPSFAEARAAADIDTVLYRAYCSYASSTPGPAREAGSQSS